MALIILDDDFIEFMDHNIDDLYRNRIQRHLPEYINPLIRFDEFQFVKRYRFSKDIVRHRLLPLVYDGETNCRRGLPVPPVVKLTTALRFFATGSYQVSADIESFICFNYLYSVVIFSKCYQIQ